MNILIPMAGLIDKTAEIAVSTKEIAKLRKEEGVARPNWATPIFSRPRPSHRGRKERTAWRNSNGYCQTGRATDPNPADVNAWNPFPTSNKEYEMDPQDSASAKKPNLGNKVTKVATYYNPRTWKRKRLWWTLGLFLVTTYVIVVIVLVPLVTLARRVRRAQNAWKKPEQNEKNWCRVM